MWGQGSAIYQLYTRRISEAFLLPHHMKRFRGNRFQVVGWILCLLHNTCSCRCGGWEKITRRNGWAWKKLDFIQTTFARATERVASTFVIFVSLSLSRTREQHTPTKNVNNTPHVQSSNLSRESKAEAFSCSFYVSFYYINIIFVR